MSQDIFQTISGALEAINAPSTSQEVRLQAQKLCDDFSDSERGLRDGLSLYAACLQQPNQNNAHIYSMRLFFLSAVSKGIRNHWTKLDLPFRESLKSASLDLVLNGTKDACVEPRYIKEKAVEIVVEIAKREWPSQWVNFLTSLKEISSKGETQAELFLKIVRRLSEDASNSDFNVALPGRRRLEIMNGLQSGVKDFFLPMFYAFLERSFSVLPSSNQKLGFILASETLTTLEACLEWIPIIVIYDSNIMNALKGFCRSPYCNQEEGVRIQVMAWKCIRILAGRKGEGNKGEGKKVTQWFAELLNPCFDENLGLPPLIPLFGIGQSNSRHPSLVWPTVSVSNIETPTSLRYLKLYDVHLQIAQVVNQLGWTHFPALWRDTFTDHNSDVITGYLKLLLRLMCHPSLRLRTYLLSAILQVCKTTLLRSAQHSTTSPKVILIETHLVHLLRCLSDHAMHIGRPSSPEAQNWISSAFSTEDYDDDDDFDSAFRISKSTTVMILKSIAKNRYLVALEFLRMRIECATGRVERPHSPFSMDLTGLWNQSMNESPEGGRMNRKGPLFRPPEAAFYDCTCFFLVDVFLPCVPEPVFDAFGTCESSQTPAAMASTEMKAALDSMMLLSPTTSLLLSSYAQGLGKFKKCYSAVPLGPTQYLGPVLEKLFECVTFRKPSESKLDCESLSPDTKNARKNACIALIDVCSASSSSNMRAHFASLLPSFCDKVLHTIRHIGVSTIEELFLYEMLVVVSNNLADANDQGAFLNDVLNQPMKKWLEESNNFSDANQILFRLNNDQSFQKEFESMQFLLHLLFSVAKRCKGIGNSPRPFWRYWGQLFPSLFSMVTVVHQLWFPELMAKYPLEKAIQQTYSEEVRAIMGTNPREDYLHDGVSATRTENQILLAKVVYSLAALRDTLYAAIAESARYKKFGLFRDEEPMKMLSHSLLTRIECMENRHLAKFITVCTGPLVLNCPIEYLNLQTFPFVIRLLEHTAKRLQTCWSYFEQKNQIGKPTEIKNLGPLLPRPSDDCCTNRDCGKCAWCQQSEIAWDSSVRILGNGVVELLGTLLNTFPDKPGVDTKTLQPQDLCNAVLSNQQTAAAVLFCLLDCVVCPDAAVSHKAMLVFQRVFYACLLYKPQFHNFTVDHLFKACLKCLLNPPSKSKHATNMLFIQVAKDIIVFARGQEKNDRIMYNQSIDSLTSTVVSPLLGIPGISQGSVSNFLEKFGTAQSGKTRRVITKDFLQTCAEAFGTQNELFENQNQYQIHNIPGEESQPKMKKPEVAWYNASSAADLGVSNLFST